MTTPQPCQGVESCRLPRGCRECPYADDTQLDADERAFLYLHRLSDNEPETSYDVPGYVFWLAAKHGSWPATRRAQHIAWPNEITDIENERYL
ncbi:MULTISPECIES: hypothetical protein [unclassified Streptomyces]|uniref:hypothetical protein n=1 Tax=unclassified Streptomyces TaxID=2593676 RepID=UPI0033DCBFE0